MEKKIKKPELLAPAGNWIMLRTAIKSGADAVYFGVDKLNMRAKAKNFTIDELPKIVSYCKNNGVDAHLAVNTIVYENELDDVEEIVLAAKKAGVDLIICWDYSVIKMCVEHGQPFCISTQASISNSGSANFYKDLGAERIVLARECTLEQIKEIKAKVDIEIETFVHGAMCVAVSGRCFMSHYAFGKSANRGECIQPCRREYEIIDKEGGASFILGDDYLLSPKDLMTIDFIEQLIESGVDSFKIEGRKRSPEYLARVVQTYRKAIDMYFEKGLSDVTKKELISDLETVYNRGFSAGFYFGQPGSDDFATQRGNIATTKKVYAGKVKNYFKKTGIAHVKLEAENLKIGDEILFVGETTGAVSFKIDNLVVEESTVSIADKGSDTTFKCEEIVRTNDKVYKIIPVEK